MLRCFKSPRSHKVERENGKTVRAPTDSRKRRNLKIEAAFTVETTLNHNTSLEEKALAGQESRSATTDANHKSMPSRRSGESSDSDSSDSTRSHRSAIAIPISQVVNGAVVKILDRLIDGEQGEHDPINFIRSVASLTEDEFSALVSYARSKRSFDISDSSSMDRRKGEFLHQILPKDGQNYRVSITAPYLHYLFLRKSSFELSTEKVGLLSKGDLTEVCNFMRDLEKSRSLKLNLAGQKNLGRSEVESICASLETGCHADAELNLSNTGLSRQDRVAFESLLALDITRIKLEGNGLEDQGWLWKAIYSKTSLHPKHIYLGSMNLSGETTANIRQNNSDKCWVHLDEQ